MELAYRVQRVEECVVGVNDYMLEDGEDPRDVALEIAESIGEWETIGLTVVE